MQLAAIGSWLLWPLMALLTGAVLLFVLRPLRRSPPGRERSGETLIYEEQLRELEADVERGTLSPKDAEPLRREISRRLLAAAEGAGQEKQGRFVSLRMLKVIGFAAVTGVTGLTLALYLTLGQPGLPDQPQKARLEKPLNELSVPELVARLERRLRENPEDLRGWKIIAPIYLQLGRYDAAIEAYGRSMQLEGRTAFGLAGLAEALTLSSEGVVVPPARQAFAAALELEPEQAKARFYLALGQAQDGDVAGALREWEAIRADAPEDAPWTGMLDAAITSARRQLEAPASAPEAPEAEPQAE
jgi:cytochrome c-type biogenesis protein CcmH